MPSSSRGVMGLYDGYVRMHGSSAEVAKTVGIPTVLLVDARSSAYSVGALLYGFKHFRQDTEVVWGGLQSRGLGESLPLPA